MGAHPCHEEATVTWGGEAAQRACEVAARGRRLVHACTHASTHARTRTQPQTHVHLPTPPSFKVRKACAATHMFKNSGTCINIRVARSSQTARQVADNIHAVLCQAVEHVPKKWANIQVRRAGE